MVWQTRTTSAPVRRRMRTLSSPILACHRSIRHQTRPTSSAHPGSAMLAIALVLAAITSYMYTRTQSVQLAAQSRQIAGNSGSLRIKDPNLRAQLALTASALSDTVEG